MAEPRRGTAAPAVLGGEEPAHAQAPEWLAVLPRCAMATEICSQQEPDLRGPQGQPAVAALMEAAVGCHHSAVDSRG